MPPLIWTPNVYSYVYLLTIVVYQKIKPQIQFWNSRVELYPCQKGNNILRRFCFLLRQYCYLGYFLMKRYLGLVEPNPGEPNVRILLLQFTYDSDIYGSVQIRLPSPYAWTSNLNIVKGYVKGSLFLTTCIKKTRRIYFVL